MIGKLQNLKPFTKYECLITRKMDGSTLRGILPTDAEGNLEPLPKDLYSEAVALVEIPNNDVEEAIRRSYVEAMEYFREFFDVLGASRYPDSKSRQIRFTTGSLFAIEELMKTFGKRFVVEYAFKHRQDIEAAKRLRNTVNVKED